MNQRDIPQNREAGPLPVSPEATGGGGVVFEQCTGAYFLALLLTKAAPPCFADGHVIEVRFQTRNEGWYTDDVLVKVEDALGSVRNLAMQVKRTLTISASEKNTECREVIYGAWRDYKNPKLFNPDLDLLAIVISRGSSALFGDFRALLQCAYICQTHEEFGSRINSQGYLPAKAKQQHNDILKIISDSEVAPTGADLWMFLRSLRLIFLDFDAPGQQSVAEITNLLAGRYIDAGSVFAGNTAWADLFELAAKAIPAAGTFRYADLSHHLRTSFRSIDNRERLAIQNLRQHSSVVLNRISKVFGDGFHLERKTLVAGLLLKVEACNTVVVTGPAGGGKSALVSEAYESMKENALVFAFRAEEFATSHLDDTFSRAQIPFQAMNLFHILACHEKKILLIESGERLLEKSQRDAFLDFLTLIADDPSWFVVITCREYSLGTFVDAFLASRPRAVFRVPLLDDSELSFIGENIPHLQGPLAHKKLRKVLRNPYLLNLAARVAWPASGPFPADEREFRRMVWKELIQREAFAENSLPYKRAMVFKQLSVRRAQSMATFVTCADLDREALHVLRLDGLVEYAHSSNELASPTHDVLEDWALLQWIEEHFASCGTDYRAFLKTLGSHPAIRRAFRQWLTTVIEVESEVASHFLMSVAFDEAIPASTRDDVLVSLLLSNSAEQLLRQIKKEILRNDCRLLVRLIHLLRVACLSVPDWLTDFTGVISSALLIPKGEAWPVILEYVAENLDQLLTRDCELIRGLVKDWTKSVTIQDPNPAGSTEAGCIASALFSLYEAGGYNTESRMKEVIEVILKIPMACKCTFLSLVERAVSHNYHDHVADTFSDMLLQGTFSAFACYCFPDDVIRVAKSRWHKQHSEEQDYYNPGLSDVFGLSHECDHDYFPASAWHGPFLALLRFHPKKGLIFILELLNNAVETYALSNTKEIELPWEVRFSIGEDIQAVQWCNDRLWCVYRGSHVAPDILKSALMALEERLYGDCKEGQDVSAVFSWVLTKSNNVALTAVLASIAVAFPEIVGAAAMPLLECRDFFQLDLVRRVRDFRPTTAALKNLIPTLPKNRLYEQERMDSDSLPHRKLDLESLALCLQGGPLRSKVQEIIDSYRRQLPPVDCQDEEDKKWRLALHRMDFRLYEITEQREDGRVIIQPSSPEADLQEVIDAHARSQEPLNIGYGLLSWSLTMIQGGGNYERLKDQWCERLEEGMNLSMAASQASPDARNVISDATSNLATACIRDHWNDLNDNQRNWCINVIISAVHEDSNNFDYGCIVSRNSHHADRPAAYILSLILCKNLTPDVREQITDALFVALTHPCHEVVSWCAEGIGTYLWQGAPGLAAKCVHLCLWRAELASGLFEANKGKPYRDRINYDELCHTANLKARSDVPTLAPIDLLYVPVDLESYEYQKEIPLLLNMLCHNDSGAIGIAFIKRLETELVQAWKTHEQQSFNERRHANYELESSILERIASLCVRSLPGDALDLCRDIVNVTDILPDKVSDFVEHLVFAEDQFHSGQAFWDIWQAIADKVVSAKLGERLDARSKGKKLVDILFLRSYWKEEVRHWEPVEGNWQRVDLLFEQLPLSTASLEAYLAYLFHIGERSMPAAFALIATKLQGKEIAHFLSTPEIAFYLDSILRRFVYGRPVLIKTDPNLRESVLFLLNELVENGSSSAFIMRDDFVTPVSCTC